MKTFSAKYKGNGLVELPAGVHLAKDVQVLVIVPEPEDREEALWARLAEEQFLAGCSEADAVYDNL